MAKLNISGMNTGTTIRPSFQSPLVIGWRIAMKSKIGRERNQRAGGKKTRSPSPGPSERG